MLIKRLWAVLSIVHTRVPYNQHVNHLRVSWQNLLNAYVIGAHECQV